uniref:Hsp20/alpha-crystallin n=1 Tax=Tigriopus japonicus TaxID=158387 RepID=Q6QX37_TIGJA|nr:Hsp20/alpha-crystallin [Tigriopus japonicus]
MTKRFSKSLDLPEDCLPDDLESEYKDGTLHLTVPKYVPEKRLRKNEDEDSPFEIIPKLMSGEFLDSNKSEIKDSNEAFQLNMDVSGFKPENLQVELTPNGVINISGHFEDKSEGRHISRQVHKSFTLPKNCQMKDVKSRLDNQGKLTITAPQDPNKAIGNEPRKLPINLEDNED